MLLPSRYSFRLVHRHKQAQAPAQLPAAPEAPHDTPSKDRRMFLKALGGAVVALAASAALPRKADALVFGSTPASNVVGIKNASNARINPATNETILEALKGNGVQKKTVTLTSSGAIHTPASGNRVRIYSNRFSLSADMNDISFRFTAGGTDFERYVSPRRGGLYGANQHPNFIEGGVDEAFYCVINGTGTVQVNVDYLEV